MQYNVILQRSGNVLVERGIESKTLHMSLGISFSEQEMRYKLATWQNDALKFISKQKSLPLFDEEDLKKICEWFQHKTEPECTIGSFTIDIQSNEADASSLEVSISGLQFAAWTSSEGLRMLPGKYHPFFKKERLYIADTCIEFYMRLKLRTGVFGDIFQL
jgi:hypothetical protein